MGRNAQPIILSDYIYSLLSLEIKKRSIERFFFERVKIILLSSLGMQNVNIAKELGFDGRKISLWRNRWYHRTNGIDLSLGDDGQLLSDKHIIKRIKELLSDNFRCGCPTKITQEDWGRLQALACENPEKYGLPFSTWTHKELSKQAKKLGIEISPSRYGVLLKKTTYNPINRNIGFSQR